MDFGGKRISGAQLSLAAILFLIGLATGAVVITLSGRSRPAPIVISPPAPTPTTAATMTPVPIRVYISGEVASPAVYEFAPNAILQDGVAAAGGLTDEADPASINLAMPLSDGMHVHIPPLGEEPVVSVEKSGGVNEPVEYAARVNINRASLEELDTLPGIGPATAQKIIDYRQTNGPFSAVEEVLNVSGIGPAKYEQLQDLISVN